MFPCESSQSPSRGQLPGQNFSPSSGLPLIDSLPPELFIKVLGHLDIPIPRNCASFCDRNWTIPYQLVCRRWCDVIRSTPQFWQEIEVQSSPEWLELCLTRCAGALATVTVKQPEPPSEVFAILRRFAPSLRTFCLESDIYNLASLPGLLSFLATPMPALETLYLSNGKLVNVPITHALFPRLTTLFLCKCVGPRPVDTAVYPSLRNLTLFGSPWKVSESYDNFLTILRMCHNLEYLSLEDDMVDAFVMQTGAGALSTGSLRHTTPVVLPRLRTLKLHGHPNPIFHVLAIMHAPQATGIALRTYLVEDTSRPPVFTRVLAPNPELRYPFLSSPHAVSLTRWDDTLFKLSLRGGESEESTFFSVHHVTHWQGCRSPMNLELNLIAVMDTFSVTSVDTLKVTGDLDEVSAETWQRVFETFSGLRVLVIDGGGSLDALWEGLARATTASLDRARDGLKAGVCCPRLSEIAIGGTPAAYSKFSASSTLFERVREALDARADAGATSLKKLQLHLEYTGPLWCNTPKNIELREAFVEDVKTLVEELDYSDLGPSQRRLARARSSRVRNDPLWLVSHLPD